MIIVCESSMAYFANLLYKDLNTISSVVHIDISKFNNGEFEINLDRDEISHKNVLVLFPTIQNINEQFLQFYLILSHLQSAKNIYAFIPYIPYSRQGASLSFASILNLLFKNLNIKRLFTIDIHSIGSVPKGFDIINILPHELYGEGLLNENEKIAMVAPDQGAIHRAQAFIRYLTEHGFTPPPLIELNKKNKLAKNLDSAKGRKCIIVDDIVDTGYTLNSAIELLKKSGATGFVVYISSYARSNLIEFHIQISNIIAKHLSY